MAASTPYIAILAVVSLVSRLTGGRAWPTWVAFIAGALAILILTVLLARRRMRRISAHTEAAAALAHGRFDAHVAGFGDEFAPLAASLNAAAERLGSVVTALQQERAQLEALLNASSDATLAIDGDGVIVYLNDAARSMFGQPASDAARGRAFIAVVRDHDFNDLLLAAARHGERSVRVVAYGPAQRWIQATAVPITGGGLWAALAVFHDLTEVRRLDSMRRDFISNVSHELRTPVAGIRAAAETLQEGAIEDPLAAVEFLGHILREADRMTQLVEELLELSRIESGAAPLTFAGFDARDLARDAVRRFAQQAERAGITIRADVPDAPLPLIADEERLERALSNLIANAIKFTPEGGRITVSAQESDGGAEISVADTGVGIEPEQLARVFERFYKADRGRSSGGLGLGLAIVKHIVRAHEGTVAVESRPGRGSTFTMRLPRR